MKQIPLYIDSQYRYFYYADDDDVLCDSCNAELTNLVFIRIQWSSRSQLGLLCMNCMRAALKSKFNTSKVEEWKLAAITYSKKLDWTPVIINFPGVQDSTKAVSVFNVYNIKSEKTIDKTKYAERESWGGAVIGAPVDVELLDKPLSNEEALKLIDKIAGSELVLPDVPDKKLLEEGK